VPERAGTVTKPRRPSVAEREAAARRAKTPDGEAMMRVRDDDRDLLGYLYRWARWLTLEQAQQLAYPGLTERYVYLRLTQMREAGILRAMRRPPTRPEETEQRGGVELVYGIGKWGIWLVERETLPESRHRKESDFLLSTTHLDHQLRMNELGIVTVRAAKEQAVELDWQANRDALIEAGKSRLIPDAIAEFDEGVGEVPTMFLVEIDQGTATFKQLEAKLMRYRQMLLYAHAHQGGQGMEAKRWRALLAAQILWICESEPRAQRVIELAARLEIRNILVRNLEAGKALLRHQVDLCARRGGGQA